MQRTSASSGEEAAEMARRCMVLNVGETTRARARARPASYDTPLFATCQLHCDKNGITIDPEPSEGARASGWKEVRNG